MNLNKTQIEGFWFSYIDSLTIISGIFFLLFIVVYTDIYIKDEKKEKYIISREQTFSKINSLLGDGTLIESLDEGGWEITLAEKILFDPNKADLSSNGKKLINEISTVLREYFFINNEMIKSNKIIVGGHADASKHRSWTTVELEQYNLYLSLRRAYAVASVLRKNLPNVNIEAIGYGHHKPKKYAKSESENRRITIVIQPIAVEYFIKDTTFTVKHFNYLSDSLYKSIIYSKIKSSSDSN